MTPRIYNRVEMVNADVAKIRDSMVRVVDNSILYWFTTMESCGATGDVHGRLTASTLVAALQHIKSKLEVLP